MRLVVVGDALLDRDLSGTVERICPDAPAPVLDAGDTRDRAGGAALAAHLAATDGHDVTLVAAPGRGPAADRVRQLLREGGVTLAELASDGTTAEKLRVRAGTHTLVRIDRGGGPARLGPVVPAVRRALHDADVVLVSDYGRGVAGHDELRRLLGELGPRVPVVWDPHPRGPAPVPGAWLVTPNESEARAATADVVDGAAATGVVAARARALVSRWGVRGVAVTRGPLGALLATPQGSPLVVHGTPSAGGDPCGAGDAFATAAAAALGGRATLGEAVEAAVARAGAFVAAGGASQIGSVEREHPRRRGHVGRTPKPGLLGVAEAAALVDEVRADGGVVVATGGCFDLLHPGHVGLLAEARRLGDLLIVLLNGDASVERLKGAGRPIQRAVDRATVLAALDAVDAVVVFDDDTPVPVLERLRPDVFAKGGDYAATELLETAALARWGGEVVILPYLSGRSTTRLVEASRAR